jgi:hypothetical protein
MVLRDTSQKIPRSHPLSGIERVRQPLVDDKYAEPAWRWLNG